MSGEHGYGQGRLIFDIATLFAGSGGLKKMMTSWRRLRSVELSEYISALRNNGKKLIHAESIGDLNDLIDFTKPLGIESQQALNEGQKLLTQGQSLMLPAPQTITLTQSPIKRIDGAREMIEKAAKI